MGRLSTIHRLAPPEEEIEMALAWLSGRLTLNEIAKARGKFNASNSLAWVAPRLRAAWLNGRLAIKEDAPVVVDKPPNGMV